MIPYKAPSQKAGFSMAEILVILVAIGLIIGVFAFKLGSSYRTIRAEEGRTGLRAVYMQMRLLYNERNSYRYKSDGSLFPAVPFNVVGNVPGFKVNDLKGAYFVDSDYKITACSNTAFTATVTGSRAPVTGVTITINQNGTISG